MDFPFFLKRQIFNLSSHTVFLLREILLERSVYVSERIVWLWGKGAGMFVCVRGTTVLFFSCFLWETKPRFPRQFVRSIKIRKKEGLVTSF